MLCAAFLDSALLKVEKEGGGGQEKRGNSTDCFSAPPVKSSLRTGGQYAFCNTDEAY